MRSENFLLAAIECCAVAWWSITARAADPPYNPDHLASDQLARISNICQIGMGLSPDERLTGGNWMGNNRLDYWTSHYRACIISLSDSLQDAIDEQITQRADAECRAKGFESGSSDLSLCVIRSVNSHPDPPPARAPTAAGPHASQDLPPASGSFASASPQERTRRERLACAALGLEPSRSAFKSCVKDLSYAFYAIDRPID